MSLMHHVRGDVLAQLRKDRDESQENVAGMAEVDRRALIAMENDPERAFPLAQIKRVAKFLHIEVDDIIRHAFEPFRPTWIDFRPTLDWDEVGWVDSPLAIAIPFGGFYSDGVTLTVKKVELMLPAISPDETFLWQWRVNLVRKRGDFRGYVADIAPIRFSKGKERKPIHIMCTAPSKAMSWGKFLSTISGFSSPKFLVKMRVETDRVNFGINMSVSSRELQDHIRKPNIRKFLQPELLDVELVRGHSPRNLHLVGWWNFTEGQT